GWPSWSPVYALNSERIQSLGASGPHHPGSPARRRLPRRVEEPGTSLFSADGPVLAAPRADRPVSARQPTPDGLEAPEGGEAARRDAAKGGGDPGVVTHARRQRPRGGERALPHLAHAGAREPRLKPALDDLMRLRRETHRAHVVRRRQ